MRRTARITTLPDSDSALLADLGERLRLARRRRRKMAHDVAIQAGITRVTLRRAEAGEPVVTMAAYVAGRHLQDERVQRPARVKPQAAIRLADCPLLHEVFIFA